MKNIFIGLLALGFGACQDENILAFSAPPPAPIVQTVEPNNAVLIRCMDKNKYLIDKFINGLESKKPLPLELLGELDELLAVANSIDINEDNLFRDTFVQLLIAEKNFVFMLQLTEINLRTYKYWTNEVIYRLNYYTALAAIDAIDSAVEMNDSVLESAKNAIQSINEIDRLQEQLILLAKNTNKINYARPVGIMHMLIDELPKLTQKLAEQKPLLEVE